LTKWDDAQGESVAGGELPMVLWEDGSWVGDHAILERALRKRLGAAGAMLLDDELLSEAQKEDSEVWRVFIEASLREPLVASWWLDEANGSAMESLLLEGVPWPLTFQALTSLQHYIFQHLQPARGDPVERARHAMAIISNKLGNKQFLLHETRPTSVDSVLFGYLCSMLYVDVPTRSLAKAVATFPSLVQYVNRILESYLKILPSSLIHIPIVDEKLYPDKQAGAARDERIAPKKTIMSYLAEYAMYGAVAAGAAYIGYTVWTQRFGDDQQDM
jgi:hypothetical protein